MRSARTATVVVFAICAVQMLLAAEDAPTFNKDVAPILYRKCIGCHRPGDIAPMPLLAYDSVRPWARAIKQKVVAREMPPWFADPDSSVKFHNDARLSQSEIDLISAWVDGGGPRGAAADARPTPRLATGWHHPSGREPDYVLEMPQVFDAPAEGKMLYQNFFVKIPFTEDLWVEAVEARPGNPALVHHFTVSQVRRRASSGTPPVDTTEFQAELLRDGRAQVAQRTPDQDRLDALRALSDRSAARGTKAVDMLAVYVPGQGFQQYPPGVARRLKAGANMYVNFNVHYHATGKPERDRSMVGLWFARGPVKSELMSLNGAAETLRVQGTEVAPGASGVMVMPNIPMDTDNFEVIGTKTYTDAIVLYSLLPHAHLRGKDWKYVVVYPDGREETILSVPRYDPNWQLVYELETPLRLPAGSKLVVTAHYNNSASNRHNPAPEKEVLWADQTWDEMFIPFVTFTLDSCCLD